MLHILSNSQRALYEAWVEYQRDYSEQQTLIQDKGAKMLTEMIGQLSGLKTVIINDKVPAKKMANRKPAASNQKPLKGWMVPLLSSWSTAAKRVPGQDIPLFEYTLPPMHLFCTLLTAFAFSPLRLPNVKIDISAPPYLDPMSLTTEEQGAIRENVTAAKSLSLTINQWIRAGLSGGSWRRSDAERRALRSFTSTLFSSPKMHTL
jgi:hypothetical protein